MFFSSLVVSAVVYVASGDVTNMPLPLPKEVKHGNETLCVDSTKFDFVIGTKKTLLEEFFEDFVFGGEIDTEVNRDEDDLKDAFERCKKRMFPNSLEKTAMRNGCLTVGHVSVKNANVKLDYGVDESYSLKVNKDGVSIDAGTVYGVYHALESLSQLVRFDFDDETYKIYNSDWEINDSPRFGYREILVDTSRHFLPVPTLKGIIESMTYAKLNTLHWHIEDDPSFPYCSKTYPLFCQKSSYSPEEKYSRADVVDVVEFARQRGVRIVAEIDIPGHTLSWCKAYPEICIANGQIISPVNPKTMEMIKGLIVEFKSIFPDSFIHLGGDEVPFQEYENDHKTKAWMNEHNMTDPKQVYEYLVKFAHQSALDVGLNPVGWSEIWTTFSTQLDKKTVMQKWRTGDSFLSMTSNGYRALWSDASLWYLDHLNINWKEMYETDPCQGLNDEQCNLVLGGGGEMWGETADTGDIQQTIWPRSGSIAERLWSPRETTDSNSFLPRLMQFRCLLNRRGIAAAPVLNAMARSQAPHPGGCLTQ